MKPHQFENIVKQQELIIKQSNLHKQYLVYVNTTVEKGYVLDVSTKNTVKKITDLSLASLNRIAIKLEKFAKIAKTRSQQDNLDKIQDKRDEIIKERNKKIEKYRNSILKSNR